MKKACCKIIYKGFYDLGPESINQLFQLYVPKRTLKSADELNIKLPQSATSFGQKNLAVRGSGYRNSYPVEIKSKSTPATFKQVINKYTEFGE